MTPADPAWFDAQYNNRLRVPDSADWLQRWARASALSRERFAPAADLAYGRSAAEKLDVFMAQSAPSVGGDAATGLAPALVFIHGGYWRALDKSDHSFIAPVFAQAGAVVVVINYGLCPAVGMAEIALQCTRALAWVWRHVAGFGGDPERIVLAGHSAGAHLAAMLMACNWPLVGADLPPALVRAGLGLSGLYDLAPLRQTPFLQPDLRLSEADVARLSPAAFAAPAGPFVALVGGDESDEFLRQNRLIRAHWGEAAVPVCDTLPGHHHFSVLTDLVDPAGRSHGHALELLGLRRRPAGG